MEVRWRGSRAELRRRLRMIPGVLAGTTPDEHGVHDLFWREVGNAVLRMLREDFKAKMLGGVGPNDGIRWAKLAVATLAKRHRAGRFDEDVLRETGALLESLTPPDEAEAADRIFRIEKGGVTVGTDDPKAEYHQKGTGHMPARPIVPTGAPTAAWERELEQACEKALVKVIERICQLGEKGMR